MKLVVFTICKDEAATIGELLDRVPKKIKGISSIETLVISDGSTDKTVELAYKHGATRVVESRKQKRLAYRFGQAINIALSMNADYAVSIDGDLQFSPEDIPKLLKPLLKDGYDFAAADRFTDPTSGKARLPSGMPANKYWANRLGAWIVGILSGEKFRDVTCGFRAYTRDTLLAININSGYTYTQETFQILAVKKKNILSVPINVKYFPGRRSRVVKSFWHFLFGSALNILRAFRDYAPLRFFGMLGLIVFLPGLISSAFVIYHWINTGSISPYKAFGFMGIYLITTGLLFWILGIVADMFDRMLKNQEKILEEVKVLRYGKD